MLSTTFFTVKSLVYHDTYLPEDRVGVAIGVLPFEVCCTEDMFLCHLDFCTLWLKAVLK